MVPPEVVVDRAASRVRSERWCASRCGLTNRSVGGQLQQRLQSQLLERLLGGGIVELLLHGVL
jgi:hypothetical protein